MINKEMIRIIFLDQERIYCKLLIAIKHQK